MNWLYVQHLSIWRVCSKHTNTKTATFVQYYREILVLWTFHGQISLTHSSRAVYGGMHQFIILLLTNQCDKFETPNGITSCEAGGIDKKGERERNILNWCAWFAYASKQRWASSRFRIVSSVISDWSVFFLLNTMINSYRVLIANTWSNEIAVIFRDNFCYSITVSVLLLTCQIGEYVIVISHKWIIVESHGWRANVYKYSYKFSFPFRELRCKIGCVQQWQYSRRSSVRTVRVCEPDQTEKKRAKIVELKM